MNESLEMLLALGPGAVARHVAALAGRVAAWASRHAGVKTLSPGAPAARGGIVSFAPRDGASVSQALKAAGVVHSLREGAIRLAPHVYNTAAEIEKALGIVERAL